MATTRDPQQNLATGNSLPLERWVYRNALALLAGIGLAAALLYGLTFYPELTGTDDTTYLVEARALVMGDGLHWVHVRGEPPMLFQPPGYPLLLTPAAWLFPAPPALTVSAQAIGVLFALACIPVLYLVLVRVFELGSLPALLVTAWMALNTMTVDLAAQKIMADPAYLFFSILAILAVERYRRSARTWSIWLGLSVLAIAWSATLRTAGLPLLPAAAIYLALRRQPRRALALTGLVVLLLLPWTVWTAAHGATPYLGIYSEQFAQTHWLEDTRPIGGIGDVVVRVVGNAWSHVRESMAYGLLPTLAGPNVQGWMAAHGLGWAGTAVGLVISALALAGYVWRVRRGITVAELYVPLYLGLALLPPWVNPRNVYPVYPFLLGYVLMSREWFPAHRRLNLQAVLTWATQGLLIVMILSALVSNRHRVQVAREFWAAGHSAWSVSDWGLPEAAAWIRQHTPADALVYYQSTQKLFLYSGRQTATSLGDLPYQLAQRDPAELAALIQRDIDYVVIVDRYDWSQQLAALIAGDSTHFSPVFRTSSQPALTVYQVSR